MTKLLINLFLKDKDDYTSVKGRERYGIFTSIIAIITNIFLFAVKFALGTVSGSIAITADAFNNLSDVGSSVVTLIGFKAAAIPGDEEHPYGHGRFEYLSGLVVVVFILLVGIEIIKSSIQKIISPEPITSSVVIIIALILTIIIKLWLGGFYKSIGGKINSETMLAAAQDSYNDSISTSAAVISIAVFYFLKINIDAYLGLAVGAYIIYSGFGLLKETINPLLGNAPDPEIVKQIEDTLLSYEQIVGVHDLMIHDYGPGRITGSAHAEVPADSDIMKAHDIIDNAEKKIESELNMPFVIHMDPIDTNCEKTNILKEKLAAICKSVCEGASIHDFRIVSGPTHTNLIFDVVVPFSCKDSKEELKSKIDNEVKKLGEHYYTVITFERSYI